MTATYAQATDDILGVFKTAWDTTGWDAVYTNVATPQKPPTGSDPWARVTLQHVTGNQASLTGGLGTARYSRAGILTIQIFTPAGEGLLEAHNLAKIITDAFEGTATANGVWFRNARVNEIGPDGDWYQVNVLIDFTYDEVK